MSHCDILVTATTSIVFLHLISDRTVIISSVLLRPQAKMAITRAKRRQENIELMAGIPYRKKPHTTPKRIKKKAEEKTEIFCIGIRPFIFNQTTKIQKFEISSIKKGLNIRFAADKNEINVHLSSGQTEKHRLIPNHFFDFRKSHNQTVSEFGHFIEQETKGRNSSSSGSGIPRRFSSDVPTRDTKSRYHKKRYSFEVEYNSNHREYRKSGDFIEINRKRNMKFISEKIKYQKKNDMK